MKRIYLDNAATTPLDKRIAYAMRDFELEFFGNPNSIHEEGQQARAQIDSAREKIADFFAAKPQEIIFTSCATESNNLAIKGIVSHYISEFGMKPHVITTQIEHQSVYNTVKDLEQQGVIEATYIKPASDGTITVEQVIKEIQDNTVLISIIFVSNEIGTVLPIREIGRQLDLLKNHKYKIVFHTDASQAVKFYNCHVGKLGVDLLTFSAHKTNGPKGIGGLYIKTGVKIDHIMSGGSQEYEKRPGTQNTAGIMGMAMSYELLGSLEDRQANGEKIRKTKNYLVEHLGKLKGIEINGTTDAELSAPDILNFSIKDTDQDMVIAKLDLKGIAASTGSACVSGSTKPSHVIMALGKAKTKSAATVRISLAKNNSTKDIDQLIEAIKSI
jgi:cysteine desulfurase